MFKFLTSTLTTAAALPLFLAWARGRAEGQIDKMQDAVFNTPGAESPVTPDVAVAGAGFLGAHFVLGQKLLGLRSWQALLSLLLGLGIGVGLFFLQNNAGTSATNRPKY